MNNSYKKVQLGDIRGVDLDFENTNILDINSAEQFKKTCGTNQSFILENVTPKVFKMILTGGTLNSTLFASSKSPITVVWENGAAADYNPLVVNRLYVLVEELNPIKLTISINVEA